MTAGWQRRHTVLAGLAIIVLSNAVVLGGVAYNRSGEPEATLRLTERELDSAEWGALQSEKSGLAMRLSWRTPAVTLKNEDPADSIDRSAFNRNANWLNQAKLAELGFDVRADVSHATDEERDRRAVEKQVYLVLEFDGPAYQSSLKWTEEQVERIRNRSPAARHQPTQDPVEYALNALERERNRNSRLFVVDAGLDPAVLRQKYPDRTRYAVVSGRVRPSYWRAGSDRRPVTGYVSAVNIDDINVPLELRPVFEGRQPTRWNSRGGDQPGFAATIVYGRRLEPRMVDAVKTAAKKP